MRGRTNNITNEKSSSSFFFIAGVRGLVKEVLSEGTG
jgi:hypothetical protein